MNVSVALTTYNGARFIEEQLRSIAGQTRRPDELVVSDDASTDDSVAIVERVCEQEELPLRLHRQPSRVGVVANFQHAIATASGDVIALCDQDDRWHADKLATIANAFAEGSPGGVFSNGSVVDESGRSTGHTLWESFGYDSSDPLVPSLLRRNVVTGATLAFASAARDLLLPLDPHGLHDVWIAMLLATTSELRPLPELLIDYRVHGANAVAMGERHVAGSVRQRRRGRQVEELRHYEAMVQRLQSRAPDRLESIEVLERKVAHLRMRCELPPSPWRRAVRIGSSLPGYARYSSGWRSPLLDLVAPTQDQAAS